MAIATRRPAVGNRCPFVEPGVGAVSTQATTRRELGPLVLSGLARGVPVDEAVAAALSDDPAPELRQLLVVNAAGGVAAHTGSAVEEWKGHKAGPGFVAGGNILAGERVVEAMAEAFLATAGELVDRLLAALVAGQEAGGDRRGKQSAALLVRRSGVEPYVDLRVDDHPDPVAELIRIFRVYDTVMLHPQGLHLPA